MRGWQSQWMMAACVVMAMAGCADDLVPSVASEADAANASDVQLGGADTFSDAEGAPDGSNTTDAVADVAAWNDAAPAEDVLAVSDVPAGGDAADVGGSNDAATAADGSDAAGGTDATATPDGGAGGDTTSGPGACDLAHPCATGVCNLAAHLCVACLSATDCGPGALCTQNVCVKAVGCASDMQCKATGQVCNLAAAACVDCNVTADCGANQACVANKCVAAAPCKTSKDCAGVCDLQTGTCVDCLADKDCTTAQFCNAQKTCQADVCSGAVCNGAVSFACVANGSGYGPATTCDDGKFCTTDSCLDGIGCQWVANTLACNDFNGCTVNDVCGNGVCGGQTVDCDDGNKCTADGCNPNIGCTHVNVAGSCDDGLACTTNDVCAAGKCTGGSVTCNDNNFCTDNVCDPVQGCLFPPTTAVCNDGNPCTTDACVAATGCVYTVIPSGACDDGNFCTDNDTCTPAGACVGTPHSCDDGNVCTLDACAAGACTHTAALDGTACGAFDGCAGNFCAGGTCIQGGNRLWELQVDGSGATDLFRGAARTPDGGFILAGETSTNGGLDAWLVKSSPTGTADWTKTYAVNGDDRFRAVAVADDGTIGAVGTKPGNAGDGWLLTANATGTAILNKTWGGNGADQFHAVAAVPGGGWILAGQKFTQNQGNNGSDDGWLVRVAADGSTVWEQTFGSQNNNGAAGDALYAVVVNADGTFTAAGTTALTQGVGIGWLLKVDANGKQVFSKNLGQNAYGTAFRGLAHNGTGYAAVGWDVGNNQGQDGFLYLADANGNNAGQYWYDVSNTDYFYAISAIPTGGFLIAGQQSTNSGQAWYLRVAGDGTELWSATWNAGGADMAMAAEVEADGTAIVAGARSGGANGSADGLARHIDLWGNASCSASGGCITVVPAACDDGNPCTFDQCSQGACSHANVPNNTPCGGNNVCDAGQCG